MVLIFNQFKHVFPVQRKISSLRLFSREIGIYDCNQESKFAPSAVI